MFPFLTLSKSVWSWFQTLQRMNTGDYFTNARQQTITISSKDYNIQKSAFQYNFTF